jgi:hemerythrin-like domain-containing protein
VSQATDVLRHEHDAILMALEILDQISKEARRGNATSADILQFLGFLREFADTCHHGKEEGLLFPAMVEAGSSATDGPVSVMLSEHEHGRALVAAMAGAAESPMSPERFADLAAEYAHHMRAHIEKENSEIFPMADRLVASDVMDGLVAAFELHEEEVMGAGRHEQLHDMLKELKAKYLDS